MKKPILYLLASLLLSHLALAEPVDTDPALSIGVGAVLEFDAPLNMPAFMSIIAFINGKLVRTAWRSSDSVMRAYLDAPTKCGFNFKKGQGRVDYDRELSEPLKITRISTMDSKKMDGEYYRAGMDPHPFFTINFWTDESDVIQDLYCMVHGSPIYGIPEPMTLAEMKAHLAGIITVKPATPKKVK